MFEYQLQAVMEYVFRRDGAKRTGFSSIVGSGPNSCVLHYRDSTRRMEEGDLVVVDVGAEVQYYTADVTRTFPVSGKFTPRQREIYEIVLQAQEEAIAAVRPGSTMGEVHRKARQVIDKAGYGRYFLHSTSHWLGMDVHDVGGRGGKLEPGMILTVEPGIYIPEERIGVRIEDDLLVTEEGHLRLSAPLPRDPDVIEEIQAEKGMADAPGRGGPQREM
jgi:Xaa-Pro aminopeptidase